jgi:hypothetical protein
LLSLHIPLLVIMMTRARLLVALLLGLTVTVSAPSADSENRERMPGCRGGGIWSCKLL